MIGNSLKYTTSNSHNVKSNTLWKYYQNKNNNKTTTTPSHLILSPSDNDKILNFMKFSDIGVDNLKDSTTFKKIQYFSKSNPQKLYSNIDEFSLKYKKLSDLYLNDYEPLTTYSYGLKRQHNFSSKSALLNNSSTHIDSKSFKTLLNYNNSIATVNHPKLFSNSAAFHNHSTTLKPSPTTVDMHSKINLPNTNPNFSLMNYLTFLEKNSLLSAENDSVQNNNPLKVSLNSK
jgi:hypothetical protein